MVKAHKPKRERRDATHPALVLRPRGDLVRVAVFVFDGLDGVVFLLFDNSRVPASPKPPSSPSASINPRGEKQCMPDALTL